MNWYVIILGIVLIILIYIIYVYYIADNSSVPYADLSKQQKNISNIDKPASSQFTYYAWIYVVSWANAVNKPIITMLSDSNKLMSLSLDQTQANLNFSIATNTATGNSQETVLITNNFPLQTWVHVAVCVNSQLVDAYLNGKLVKSQRLNNLPTVTTSTGQYIILGDGTDNDKLKINVAKFTRLAKYAQPADVWKNYLAGSGQSNSSDNYKVQVSILQGGSVTQVFDILKA